MKRIKNLSVPLLIIVLSFQNSCRDIGEFKWGIKVGNLVYSENTVFVGEKELPFLKEVADNQLVFTEKTGTLASVTNNSILVIGISEKTPYGLLRKVTGVKTNGSDLEIGTEDAQLTDAIMEGTIKFEKTLQEKDFRLGTKIDGVFAKGPVKSFDGLAVTMDDFEIFKDGAKSAIINGSTGVSCELDLELTIKSREIERIDVTTKLSRIDEVTISSNAAFSGKKEVSLATFVHNPVIIDSLVFVPEVTLNCGFDGSISNPVSYGVRQDRAITSKFRFENASWSEDPLIHSESFDFTKPQVTDNSELKVFTGPEINLKLFGVPLQAVKTTGHFILKADKGGSPLWKLSIGNDGKNTIKSDIIYSGNDYSSDIVVATSEICNSAN